VEEAAKLKHVQAELRAVDTRLSADVAQLRATIDAAVVSLADAQ